MDNDELQQPNGNGAAAAAIAIDASAVVRKHGMNSAENKVYLKLLEGDTNVMDICARIGMKYGSVYAALGNLSNDGIVGRRGTGRFTYYLTPESKPGLPGAPVDASGRDVTGPSAEASGTDATTIIDAPTVVEKYVEAAATSGLTDAEKQLIGTYGLNDRDIAAYEALLKHGGDGARSDVLARDLNINADIAKARMKKPVEAGLARLDRSYFAITPRGFFASEAAKNRTMLKSANDELRETSRKLDNARLEIFNEQETNRVLTKTTEANARTIEAFKRSKTVPAEAKPERTAADKMVESLYESALKGLSHTAADVYRALAGVNGAIDKKQVASLLPDVNDFKVNLALDGELVKMGLARKDGEAYSAMPLADVLIAPLVERAKKAEAERNGAVSERNAATEKLERMSKAGGFGKAELEYMASAGINTIGIEAYRSLLDDGPASVKELSERMHTDSGMFVTQLDGLRKAGLASYNSGRLGPVRVGELMWTELRRSREALKAKDAEPVIAAARPDDIAKPKDGGTAALEPARQREEPDETSSPAEKFSDNEIKYMSGKGVHRDARATYRSLVKRGSIDTSGMEEGRAQAGHLRALEAAGLAMSSGGVYSPKTLTDALYGDLQLAASMSRGRAASIEPLVMMITGGEAGRVLENLKVDKETRTVLACRAPVRLHAVRHASGQSADVRAEGGQHRGGGGGGGE
ncbi:MAG: helix-turn-helix domain-containing protein [Candidatus Aenigmarchaeota archaeon]|nr:helix-turn-helix domain-containing protein [Candidatus Aenigmarchaeota archaeon]